MKDFFAKLDNDTLIIAGMIAIAIIYSYNADGIQVVNNIVSAFAGFIGGSYVNSKKEP